VRKAIIISGYPTAHAHPHKEAPRPPGSLSLQLHSPQHGLLRPLDEVAALLLAALHVLELAVLQHAGEIAPHPGVVAGAAGHGAPPGDDPLALLGGLELCVAYCGAWRCFKVRLRLG